MRAVDHRFALGKPALPSAPAKKSFSSVSSPILAWSTVRSTAGPDCSPRALGAEHPGCPVEKLRLPLGDLVGMNVELLS